MDTETKNTSEHLKKERSMNPDDFLVISRTIDAFYLSRPMKDAARRKEYYRHIYDLPYHQVLETLKNHIRTCRFPPTIEELRGEMVASSSETVKKHPRPEMELTEQRKMKIVKVRQEYTRPDCTSGMSRKEFILLYGAISSLYTKNSLIDVKTRTIWYEMLKDIPYMAALENLLSHASHCPYAPTVAELRGEDITEVQNGMKKPTKPAARQNSFNNFHQREYDWEEMERKLLNC